jgi:hypothetical protein
VVGDVVLYFAKTVGLEMDYELYHDESMEGGGYWHGMLLVPVPNKQEISDLLLKARENTRYSDKLGIKKVDRKGRIYNCASAWTNVGVAGLRSKNTGRNEPIFIGAHKKGQPQYESVNIHGMKFILFRERDCHRQMTGYKDHASKIETTFRFGIKGGLHLLGSSENPISITRIHFDGHQHHHRHVDQERLISRIKGMRSYCTFAKRDDLIDDRHSDHRKPDSQSYEDCQFLQLTDLLIGCFRTSLGFHTKEIHAELAAPVKDLVDKYLKGYARMRNSRWLNSFAISQCFLEDGKWKFEGIQRNLAEGKQLKISGND